MFYYWIPRFRSLERPRTSLKINGKHAEAEQLRLFLVLKAEIIDSTGTGAQSTLRNVEIPDDPDDGDPGVYGLEKGTIWKLMFTRVMSNEVLDCSKKYISILSTSIARTRFLCVWNLKGKAVRMNTLMWLKRYSVYSLVSTEVLTRPSSPSRPVHTETISILRGYSRPVGSIYRTSSKHCLINARYPFCSWVDWGNME